MANQAVLIGKLGEKEELEKIAVAAGFNWREILVIETASGTGDDVSEEIKEQLDKILNGDALGNGGKFLFYYSGPKIRE